MKKIKTVADIPQFFALVCSDIEVREILESLGYTEEGVDTLFIKVDKSGADIQSAYGCMGTPTMGKAVIKIKQVKFKNKGENYENYI